MPLPTNIRTMDELVLRAAFELDPTDLIYINKNCVSGPLAADQTNDVWPYESPKVLLSEAEYLDFVSTSAEDNATGDGMRGFLVSGLDENYDVIKELVIPNGLTPVRTTQKFFRVNQLRVAAPNGVTKNNIGRITGTAAVSGTVQCLFEAGTGFDQSTHFTIPRGYTAYFPSIQMNVSRTSGSGRRAASFNLVGEIPEVKVESVLFDLSNDGSGFVHFNPTMPRRFSDTIDFKLTATSETNATKVTAAVDIILVTGNFIVNDNTL